LLKEQNINLTNIIKNKDNCLEKSKLSYSRLNQEYEELINQNNKHNNIINEKEIKINELNNKVSRIEKENIKLQREINIKEKDFEDIEKEYEYQLSLKDDEIELLKSQLTAQ
jgi:predicted nuclease with TOPRIM domain